MIKHPHPPIYYSVVDFCIFFGGCCGVLSYFWEKFFIFFILLRYWCRVMGLYIYERFFNIYKQTLAAFAFNMFILCL